MSRRPAFHTLRKIVLPFALLFGVLAGTSVARWPSHEKNDPAFERIHSIVSALSAISGLSEEHRVAYGRMDKEQLRKFLVKRVRKTLKSSEIRADELSLKMFGLVPQDFDLKKSTIDLLTEQAAAFYDYDKKKLFLMNNVSVDAEGETLAHELGHALADQHFNLSKYMNDVNGDDDANLARTAVVEGQASWLMLAYALQQSGQKPQPPENMLKDAFGDDTTSAAEYPVLKASPLYIQQSLLFPYSEGTRFFDAVYRKEGKPAFSNVFTEPPNDSSQVLHPERYFNHVKPMRPPLPGLFLFGNQKHITEGDMGEFDHTILLWQYFDEKAAKRLAPHLRGGQFRIVADKGRPPVLLYASEWDSREQADRFFAAYQHVLRTKWKLCAVLSNSSDLFAGKGDNGYFVARLKGWRVTSVEGISNLNDWKELEGTSSHDTQSGAAE